MFGFADYQAIIKTKKIRFDIFCFRCYCKLFFNVYKYTIIDYQRKEATYSECFGFNRMHGTAKLCWLIFLILHLNEIKNTQNKIENEIESPLLSAAVQ